MTQTVKDGLAQRGKTWSYIVRVRDPLTGKTKPQWKGGYATKAEAKRARNDARALADKGTAVAASRITVREYLDFWLEASTSRVRPTTLASYRMHVEQHIAPRIGGHRLQELTPTMVDKLYSDLLRDGRKRKGKDSGLSPNTVRRIAATLHKALADATRKRLLPFNPADSVDLPKVERHESGAGDLQTWTRPELDVFLEHIRDDRLFPMWRLAAWTGMRRGELAGLTWRDVDLGSGTITVRRARVAVSSTDVRESGPKTPGSRCRVELDDETTAALDAWLERQEQERSAWPGEWPDHGLVFTLQDGSGLHPDYFSRAFRGHVKRAGLPTLRLHDLRHTHATLMLASGVPVKVVSERLGHATPAFTMAVYQHVLPGQQREAVQRLAGDGRALANR